jgi:hypothetical protein
MIDFGIATPVAYELYSRVTDIIDELASCQLSWNLSNSFSMSW